MLKDYLSSEPLKLNKDSLFTNKYGKRLSKRATIDMFRQTALRAGLIKQSDKRKITFHKLRHTFASEMIQK